MSSADEFQDETLQCCVCHRTFTYTAAQQKKHQQQGYRNKPKRCSKCRRGKNPPAKSGQMSVEDTLSEVCKAVTELRIFSEQQFKRLHERLNELEDSFLEDDDGAEEKDDRSH